MEKKLQIIYKPIDELVPYEKNPRKNDQAVEMVAASIKEFGFKVPIILDAAGVIIAGHTRLKAAKKLGLTEVPTVIADDLTPEQAKALRLVDNKAAEQSMWDIDLLQNELTTLENCGIDMTAFEFDFELDIKDQDEKAHANGALRSRYIEPPFSVLDTRTGDWRDRQSTWRKLFDSKAGRLDTPDSRGLVGLKQLGMSDISEFDPVLCEILINWFCPLHGKIIDPFAGGCVRGFVSAYLGAFYTGVDLSARQIDNNYAQFDNAANAENLLNEPTQRPNWINGDSANITKLAPDEYDFLLMCPPYADLEKYSEDPRDLSQMDYEAFCAAYEKIIAQTVSMLKNNTFAACVVGEIRDKKGIYRNFVGETVKAFEAAGAKYYNEIILVNAVGTLARRVGKYMAASRKIGKMHQNVLIFVKGDPKNATDKLEKYEYEFDDKSESCD